MTDIEALAKLRAPFAPHQISKLPKETKAQIEARRNDKSLMVWKCPECGGPHHKNAVHLDYVGHAALTDRLLDVDPAWSWEPMAVTSEGLPAIDKNGGLWIKLTVAGVTRLGYGSADGKNGGDAIKEIIGDALRNAAMRFGAALDLWHKGDLHADDAEEPRQPTPRHDPPPARQQDADRTDSAKPVNGQNASAAEAAHAAAGECITAFEKMTIADSSKFDAMLESKKYKTIIERLRADFPALHRKVTEARDAAYERMDNVPY